ncbi:MAG: hypothetical protein QXR53_02235 [Candidatus Norongarragalinales archaeon]
MTKTNALAVLFLLLFAASSVFSEEVPSPSPAELPLQAPPSVDVTSTTAFAIVNHETAPLGLAVLVLLAFGVFLDKFVK